MAWPVFAGFALATNAMLDPWPTVCISFAEPGWKLVSPWYVAVMECAPTERAAVVNEALSLASAKVPNGVAPSRNLTEPVGVPLDGSTVAVRVMDWFNDDG